MHLREPSSHRAAVGGLVLAALLAACAGGPRSDVTPPPGDDDFPGFAGEDELAGDEAARDPAPDRPFNSSSSGVECLMTVEGDGCRDSDRQRQLPVGDGSLDPFATGDAEAQADADGSPAH